MALSPLDGRYADKCDALRPLASEYGLMYYRLLVEIRWFQALSAESLIPEVPVLSKEAHAFLESLIERFDSTSAERIKTIELTTNHDVKAVEYFIKESFQSHSELAPLVEFVHFACTSEDINNLAYALMVKSIRKDVIIPHINKVMTALKGLSERYADTAMLARTHGQAASPTTLGKEMANVYYRLARLVTYFEKIALLGKINGAVGNFNAHHIAYPEVDWLAFSHAFIDHLGLECNELTTQIEPHDYLADYFDCVKRINTVMIDLCRDMWGYISLHYFTQIPVAGEIGSSTMPHKINPIDFENAEGNFGMANALFGYFSDKLPISRWQRDLSDSTVLRNIGVACGYTLIALQSLSRGLAKVDVNMLQLEQDLEAHWEVLAEALQTVMRRYHIAEPYEKLKALTRGRKITQALLQEFIEGLDLPTDIKIKLKDLKPSQYTGLAAKLVSKIL